MYIFADSGASKTNWVITDTKGLHVADFKTLGLNPYFWKTRQIFDEISSSFPENGLELKVEKVFFYGAGCDSRDSYQSLYDALESFFPLAIIYIYSDMLGTARALFNNKDGVAAILGTGSNSCVFNGHTIYRKAISLGYILGDEGSGAYIGKAFIKNYLEGQFDEELTEKIKLATGANIDSVLSAVYSKPQPNRYLASYCNFVKSEISHPQLRIIVENAFNLFIDKYIAIFPESKYLSVGFCGSVAFHFSEILLSVAARKNIKIMDIVQNPLNGIIKYHKEKGFF